MSMQKLPAPRLPSQNYGPFPVVSKVGQDTISVLVIPWSSVRAGTVEVVMVDNQLDAIAPANSGYVKSLGTEVTFSGLIKGSYDLIKRMRITSLTGAASLRLDESRQYDDLEIGVRLFVGGTPFIPTSLIIPAGVALNVQVQVNGTFRYW